MTPYFVVFIAVVLVSLELSVVSSLVCSPDCPNIVSRSEWGAAAPKESPSLLSNPVEYVFIHHTDTPTCTSKADCMSRVRNMQHYHQNERNFNDIGYSFLFGSDGNIYEGRGWDTVGAHTYQYNSLGYGFSAIGNYESVVPNSLIQTNIQKLIQCGIDTGKISTQYKLRGHREMKATQCPGTAFFNLIKTWPHH